MAKKVKTALLLMPAMLCFGCLHMADQGERGTSPSSQQAKPEAEYLSATTVQASEEGDGETALENALIWSQKYSEAVERLVLLQEKNRQLEDKSRKQVEQNARLQKELDQCQKELAEANAMLIDMRSELDQWKADVLGFRQEIRRAQETQLIALHRVLNLLGDETPQEISSGLTASRQEQGAGQ